MTRFTKVLSSGPGGIVVEADDGQQYTLKGTVAWRGNNPGNIRPGNPAIDAMSIGTQNAGSNGKFLVFPDRSTGNAAREHVLFTTYGGSTLENAIQHYAPQGDNNDTAAYVAALANAAGVSPQTLMKDMTPAQRSALMAAQLRVENNTPGTIAAPEGQSVPQELVQSMNGVPLPPGSIPEAESGVPAAGDLAQGAASPGLNKLLPFAANGVVLPKGTIPPSVTPGMDYGASADNPLILPGFDVLRHVAGVSDPIGPGPSAQELATMTPANAPMPVRTPNSTSVVAAPPLPVRTPNSNALVPAPAAQTARTASGAIVPVGLTTMPNGTTVNVSRAPDGSAIITPVRSPTDIPGLGDVAKPGYVAASPVGQAIGAAISDASGQVGNAMTEGLRAVQTMGQNIGTSVRDFGTNALGVLAPIGTAASGLIGDLKSAAISTGIKNVEQEATQKAQELGGALSGGLSELGIGAMKMLPFGGQQQETPAVPVLQPGALVAGGQEGGGGSGGGSASFDNPWAGASASAASVVGNALISPSMRPAPSQEVLNPAWNSWNEARQRLLTAPDGATSTLQDIHDKQDSATMAAQQSAETLAQKMQRIASMIGAAPSKYITAPSVAPTTWDGSPDGFASAPAAAPSIVSLLSGKSAEVGATGSAQGGAYQYKVMPDGSIMNLTTGRVSAAAPANVPAPVQSSAPGASFLAAQGQDTSGMNGAQVQMALNAAIGGHQKGSFGAGNP